MARAVNAAIAVAAQPYRSQVRVLDMTDVFTPGGRYRAAMTVNGRETLVREPDGIHLNDAGARRGAGHRARAAAGGLRRAGLRKRCVPVAATYRLTGRRSLAGP